MFCRFLSIIVRASIFAGKQARPPLYSASRIRDFSASSPPDSLSNPTTNTITLSRFTVLIIASSELLDRLSIPSVTRSKAFLGYLAFDMLSSARRTAS